MHEVLILGVGIMVGMIGTLVIHWLGMINPMLSMVSLLIGITVGLTTLYLQVRKIKN